MKLLTNLVLALFCLFTPIQIIAQENSTTPTKEIPRKTYTTGRVAQGGLEIDGKIDDEAWNNVEWGGDFIEREPDEGNAPSQQTSFKVLYDDKYIYFAFRAHDDDPALIEKRMSRRDGFAGDWVEINIDSYNDKRTAFSFTGSVSGVKGDEYISNNGDNWDGNWDPIWYLKTNIDDKGWTAEFKIPLSQLRFADKTVHSWGLQVQRRVFRENERSVWQNIPRSAAGWVHLFGELNGIEGIKPQKQVEIQPYTVAKAEKFEKEEGNPFADGSDSNVSFGVDGKIGLTSDITLDFTVNPDFGQVEADPSQVNLSAFRLFFSERRPFFIEGNDILNFRLSQSQAGGPFNRDNLFYSRRIGRSPQYYPDADDIEYVDQLDNTTILGAVKLTGKNKKGMSWSVLESVTDRERATVQDENGDQRKVVVEPLTNYLVGRIQQDINKGNTIVGGMFTATNRKIKDGDEHLNFLHTDAYSAGLDLLHHWKDRKYYFGVKGVVSQVKGSTEAITLTQESSERFFQRPDNNHGDVDTTRTSLKGTGGTFKLGKKSGNIIFQTGATWRSPELELNDAGFLRSADQVNQWTWAQWRKLDPFSIFNSVRVNVNQYVHWDFDGVNTYRGANINAHFNFKNQWGLGTGVTVDGEQISNAGLRGGPSFTNPGGVNHWYWIGTDQRKKFRVQLNQWNYWGNDKYHRNQGVFVGFTYQPTNSMSVQFNPSVSSTKDETQYVQTSTFGSDSRYIIGKISQKTYRLSFRLNYNINPNLSIQYWGQPFISEGQYSNFKRITDSNASDYLDRFHEFTGNEILYNSENEEYLIDENADGTTDYTIGNPDFNFVQFRSNMVARWEYIPGSTVFFVWTQSRTAFPSISEDHNFEGLTDELFTEKPHNIFLVKFTYRFVL